MNNAALVTQGSAGSTWFKSILGAKTLAGNCKSFTNRHIHTAIVPDVKKIVYIYSNPYDTILSYYRRKFMSNTIHCRHMGGDVDFLSKHTGLSLLDFLSLEYDPFMIERHFKNYYYNEDRTYDLMMVKYEHIPNYIEDILEWFDSSHKINEFQFKSRKSNYKDQPQKIQELLEKTWGNLMAFQQKLEPFIIMEKK